MKNVNISNIFSIVMCYTGAVIGAGFASGQEIMSFFAGYGEHGLYGMVVCGLMFFAYGYVVLNKIHKYDISSFSEYFESITGRRVAVFVQAISYGFMFASFAVMVSGSGAVAQQLFGMNTLGVVFMAVLCFAVFLKGVDGIIAVNSFMTPLIVMGILLVGGWAIVCGDRMAAYVPAISRLTDNFFVSALVYVSYNTVTMIGVFIPLKKHITSRRVAFLSSLVSGMVLSVMGVILWITLRIFRSGLAGVDVPMLYIAEQSGETMKYIYAAVLYMAMITTAVSSGFAFLEFVRRFIPLGNRTLAALICAASVPLAYVGFAELVDKLYRLFGYVGLFVLAVVLADGFADNRKRRSH